MRRVLWMFAAVCFSAASASASPITASDIEQIFNFDLTSLAPGPPFERVVVVVSAGAASGLTTEQFWGYPDADGGGAATLLFSAVKNVGSVGTSVNVPVFAGFTDGLFSIGVVGTASGVTFEAGLEAFGRLDDGSLTQRVDPVLSTPVPEPTTFSLLVLGAVGVMVRRRRPHRM